MNSFSDSFINYLQDFYKTDIQARDLQKAKACLKDYLGVTLAGSSALFKNHPDLKNLMENDHSGVKVIGSKFGSNLLNCALLNGMSAHYLELDDGYRYGMVHPGAVIFSTLLPVAEKYKVSGENFLKATVVAYEACLRLARAMQPMLKEKGLHATGVVAGVGAALGLGFLLGYSKIQLKAVLAASATSASGILEVIRDESQLKPFNCGQAALNALSSALIGQSGMIGPNDVLGGSQGFFFVNSNLSAIHDLLKPQEESLIHGIYIKPYAACRHAHAPIGAALNLKEANKIDFEKIKEVTVETYKYAVVFHDHQEVSSPTSAKMSTPYGVAVALIYGAAGLQEFTPEVVVLDKVRALSKKIFVLENKELSKLVPHKRSAIVRVELNDGGYFEYRVDYPKGEPENALSSSELDEKFTSLASFAKVSMEAQSEILNIIDNIETRMGELYEYL